VFEGSVREPAEKLGALFEAPLKFTVVVPTVVVENTARSWPPPVPAGPCGPAAPIQLPPTEKQPAARLIPPVLYIEEVAVEKLAIPPTESLLPGVDVPTPTLPPLLIMKYVPVDEPTDRSGEFDTPDEPSMENCAQGVEVPIPIRPLPPVPRIVNAGVVEPSFETWNELVYVEPISTANRENGDDVDTPTLPPLLMTK
jgi:hypothetical protein